MHTNEAKNTASKRCTTLWVRVVVAVGALGLVFWHIEWDKLKAAFAQMNGWVFVGVLAIYMVSQVLLAVRWLILVRALGIDLAFFPAVKLHFIGLFYNNAMPSSIGGDFLRAWYVSKHTDRRMEAALSVFVDRAMGLMGIFLMAIFSYIFLMNPLDFQGAATQKSSESPVLGLVLKVCLAGVVFLVCALGAGCANSSFKRWAKRVALNIWQKLRVVIGKSRDVIVVYWKRPMVLLLTLGLTLFLQSVTIWAFWLLGRDLGIEVGIKYYFVIFPGMWVVAALPISIAGVGVMEGGIALLFFRLAHVPLAQGTCLSLCQRFIWIIGSIPGGIIHLMGRHLPETFSFDEWERQE
ncbi:MAG: flippase-like domain-containing protein [Phycisphaerae bacterium]|nr:flippase-like domain-containing protein [Phycisphaerae bacterium]